jgi:hypothetical protein
MAVSIPALICGQTSHICPMKDGKYGISYLQDDGGQIRDVWPYIEADIKTAMR